MKYEFVWSINDVNKMAADGWRMFSVVVYPSYRDRGHDIEPRHGYLLYFEEEKPAP